MKSIKYLFCALLATAFVGCAEDEAFVSGPQDSGAQLSFATSSVDVQLMPTDATEYEIVATRAITDAAASYEVELTPAAGSEDIFSVSTLAFAEGESEAKVKVSFPDAEIGVTYKATLSIKSDDIAIYKSSTVSISIIREYTWVPFSDANGNTEAFWIDELLGLYGIDPLTGPVVVYEAKEIKGYLKVVGAYSDNYFMKTVEKTAADFGVVAHNPNLELYIHAEDPNAVWIPIQSSGMVLDPAFGEMYFGSICPDNGFGGSPFYGVMADRKITFPAKGLAVFESLAPEDIYYANNVGVMGVILPGAEAVSEVTVEYIGLFTDASTKADNGVFNFFVNDDTAKVLYALVEGKDVDVDAIAAQMADGTIASTELESYDAPVYVPVPAPGTYSVVAASFNDKGTLGICSAASFKVADAGAPAVLSIREGIYSVNVDSSQGSTPTEFYVSSVDDDVFQMSDIFGFSTQSMYTCAIDRDNDVAMVTPNFGFNKPFAYGDAEHTILLAYGGAGAEYDEPWPIALSEVDGALQPSSVATDKMCLDGYNADGGYLGSFFLVSEGAVITYVGALPASSPAKAMATTSKLISPVLRHAISAKGAVAVKKVQLTKRENLETISL